MRIKDRMYTMYKRFKNTIEYQLLIRFLLTTELIYLSVILIFMCCDELDGNGFWQYYNLHNEGYKTITVLEHFEEDEDVFTIKYNKNVEITIHRLNCSVMIDGKEYLFKADAADVIGQNSGKESRVFAAERREVGGYIYSSPDRKDIFFSYDTDDKWNLFAQKAAQRFEFRYKGKVLYKVYIYFIMIIMILAKFKKSNAKSVLDIVLDKVFESKIYDNYLSRKLKITERKVPVVSKENYSNKAIKQNPEYELLENEEVKVRYTPEMIVALKSIKSGDYKISAKQRETIKEEVKKWNGNLELRGPITANNAMGHEAVLLKIGRRIPFKKKIGQK